MLFVHVVNRKCIKKQLHVHFVVFGIMAWLEKEIDENGESVKKSEVDSDGSVK